MKKLFSCILVLAMLAAGTAISFAADAIIFSKDATLLDFRTFFDNITIKSGVTLTTKNFSPDPQGVEISGTLTVEPGAKIVGPGILIFSKGSECKGMDLYYKVGEQYKTLPEDPISHIFSEVEMRDSYYRPEFKYSSVVDGWVWTTEWEVDPFSKDQDSSEQNPVIIDNSGSSEYFEFTDVSGADYYYSAVVWAVTNGVTAGTAKHINGEKILYDFSPMDTCTRAQVVSFLWRAQGKPNPVSSANPFTDVKTANYFYNPVLWAVEKNITAGTTATTFSPAESCTRGQVISFLWRALGKPQATEDVMAKMTEFYGSSYYTPALAWAEGKGIITSKQITADFPKESCPRADIVYYIYKALAE